MTIDFYYSAGSAPCRTVLVTAKAVGVELNLKPLDLMDKKEHLTPEFIKINPQHCIPTIVDNGFSLWESNAIATYLVQKYGKDDSLYPKEPKRRAIVDQRLYFNNGVLLTRFGEYYYPIMMGKGTPDPEKYKKIQEALEFLETFLDGGEYAAGDFISVADIALGSAIATYQVAKFDLSSYKNVTRWYKKIQKAIPGFEEFNGLDVLTKIFEQFLNKK